MTKIRLRIMSALLIALSLTPSGLSLADGAKAVPSDAKKLAEATRNQRSLNRSGARIAIEAAVREAERRGVGLAISVVDAGGHLIAAERVDRTFPASAHISEGKARTAVSFGKPTSFFEKTIREGRTPMVALDDGFTPLQGGVPVEFDGQILGGIGASGASSAAEDEELALIAQKAVLASLGR